MTRNSFGRIADHLVDKVSVGISEAEDNWLEDDDGLVLREITKAHLHEISFTAYPAFTDTSAELKTLSEFRQASTSQRSIDALLLELNQLLAELNL